MHKFQEELIAHEQRKESIGRGLSLKLAHDINEEQRGSTNDYCYLYKDGKKISEVVFRRGGIFKPFTEKNPYCQLIQYPDIHIDGGCYKSFHCIIDMDGSIVLSDEKEYSSSHVSYIGGVLAYSGGNDSSVINLLNGEAIVKSGYSSGLKSESFMFVENAIEGKVQNVRAVWKIEYATGNYYIFK